ncbi:hypothetical protein [Rhizobium sp. CECT 9324]|uniref:hypothetical protein n=1 Tax=Rhizobium sp. CECT 9324 TaxID=2845820 RepID=UPI001E5C7713|nr:hypothetical protein [Rhizobium sp. CECT 9324]
MSEIFSDKDWDRATRDNNCFACFIIDEQALPGPSIDMSGLHAPIIFLADGLGSPVDVAGAQVIYKPSQGGDILALVRAFCLPASSLATRK